MRSKYPDSRGLVDIAVGKETEVSMLGLGSGEECEPGISRAELRNDPAVLSMVARKACASFASSPLRAVISVVGV